MATRERRVTRRSDFERLTQKGRSWANRLLVLKALPNSLPLTRYGFSVSRAIGNAVSRNRVKRRLRELTRERRVRSGWDILIVARGPIAESKFEDIDRALAQLLRQSKLSEGEREEIVTKAD